MVDNRLAALLGLAFLVACEGTRLNQGAIDTRQLEAQPASIDGQGTLLDDVAIRTYPKM